MKMFETARQFLYEIFEEEKLEREKEYVQALEKYEIDPKTTAEKFEAAEKEEQEGHALYWADKYAEAIKRYEKAVKLIEYDASSFTEEEKKRAEALWISCKLKNACCLVGVGAHHQVRNLCDQVLEIDNMHVEALFIRAWSSMYKYKMYLDLAELDIKKALQIEPNNRVLMSTYRVLQCTKEMSNYEDPEEYNEEDLAIDLDKRDVKIQDKVVIKEIDFKNALDIDLDNKGLRRRRRSPLSIHSKDLDHCF